MVFSWWRRWHRNKYREQPLTQAELAILSSQVPVFHKLQPALKNRLIQTTQVLRNEQQFEGCKGLEINDEIKLSICGNIALMLLGVEDYYFEGVTSILVFPNSFQRRHRSQWLENEVTNAGEAWQYGPIILSWADCQAGSPLRSHGRNVIIHEFAHHLDSIDGEMGGSIQMPNSESERQWHQVAAAELKELRDDVHAGRRTVLDAYGATNEAEFFAVLSEAFFEMPDQLQQTHQELYRLLTIYYQTDPLQWN